MQKAVEVARYILYTAYKYGDVITNLKLQKLLYYVQAEYLVKNNGAPLFSDPIEAWQFGPVVREVYDKYKSYGRKPIDDPSLPENSQPDFAFSDNEKKIIEEALEKYMSYSAFELVASIHAEKPWQDAYQPGKANIISPESMYAYYKSLELEREQLIASID